MISVKKNILEFIGFLTLSSLVLILKKSTMIEKVENYMDKSLVLRYLQLVFTYFSPLTLIVTTAVTVWLIKYNRKRARLVHLIEKIPGPPALPFIGALLLLLLLYRFLMNKLVRLFSGNAIEINVEHDGKLTEHL